ncbi:serine hydrolase [Frondihabitans sp. PhB188]|uniref:serine hydrolase domain-containing protein n=1 Tax=Frondihabitans sp. PhB188 TaxID=2485200 RepID=UPI001F468A8D|nr:serine hydrolase [Frondihabitans sp. PhB188]
MTNDALTRSSPSAHDIDAGGIEALIDALESTAEVEPHSLMVLRGGEVVAEGWWAPYAPDRQHLLYSLSKSFTSTAVGIATAEGLLSLDDTIISHFPELDAEITDERTRRITVRHLLAMASGHREETVERASTLDPADLVRGFLLMPPDEEPGTLFCYNQPCTYTLGAIIQRATGGTLVDYLRPRLFDPLGIGEVGWLTHPSGEQLGFSGFHAPTSAVAKLAQLYLNGGVWNGVQLVPTAYVDEATRLQVDNAAVGGSPDWSQGYGFQFWMATHGFRGDGAYGQFAVVLPELDLVVAMTGQSIDMQAVLDAVWAHLLPAVGAGTASPSSDTALAARLASLALPVPPGTGATLEPASFEPGPGNRLPTLTSVVLGAGRTATLVDKGLPLRLPLGDGEWLVSDAIAASASPGEAGGVRLDVAFIETPHRLVVELDQSAGTFAAAWVTEPLHGLPLARVRMPRP